MKDYTEQQLRSMTESQFDDVVIQVHSRYMELANKIVSIDKRTAHVLTDPSVNRSKVNRIMNDRARLKREIDALRPIHDLVEYLAETRITTFTDWWNRRRKLPDWPESVKL